MWRSFNEVVLSFVNGVTDEPSLREAARDVLIEVEETIEGGPELPLDAKSFLDTPVATFQYICTFVGTIRSFTKPAART